MQNKQSVLNEIEMVSTLKVVTQAYQEISVIRMQKIRGSVVKTRDYIADLSDVFFDVKAAYRKQIEDLSKHHKGKKGVVTSFSTLNKNRKSISIFLSPNTRLQGEIISHVFAMFVEQTKDKTTDLMIIGKVGKDLYEQLIDKKPYLYFEVPEANVSVADMQPIIFNIIKYEMVNVYHGRFENIINQTAVATNVSGDQNLDQIDRQGSDKKFLFEPSLFTILNFFETQIFSSLFKQSIYESQLAQFASRINAMEEALQNIEKNTNKLMGDKRRIHRMTNDKKQLNTLSGISLWK